MLYSWLIMITSAELLAYQARPDLLAERVILVTGAGRGIGREVALAYGQHGATVILLDKNIRDLESVYDAIEAAGGPQPAIYPMNLEGATWKDYVDLAANLEQNFARLDGLLQNAGWVGGLTPLRHYSPEQWLRVTTINLQAPFMLLHTCLPLLELAADPAVVFSTHHVRRAYWGAYGVAKAGLAGLLDILADEYRGERSMRVNGIDTGTVRTLLRAENYPGEDPKQHPEPVQAVPAYLYLMGSDSAGISGQNFHLALTGDGDHEDHDAPAR